MRTTRLSRVLVAASCGAGLLAVMAGPAAAQQGPPGNNGTVKIDGVAFDDHPNNEPHVGCTFQVDFYDYDEGDLQATVLFEAWPPTGSGQDLLSDELDIGEDPNGGGTDLDASGTYDLSDALAGFTPSQQGFHVKLTVHAEGSQGADVKHKVFWVSGCETPTTSSSTSTSSTSSSTTSSSTTSSVPGGSTTSTPGGSTTSSVPGGTTPSTGPSGVSPSAPTTTPAGAEGALPRTGSNTVPLAVGAVALIALGTGGVLGARHLRGAKQ
jgi:hypothetical protein